MKKYTNWKKLFLNSSPEKINKILKNPKKYLKYKPDQYTPDYLNKLKYRLKTRYHDNIQQRRTSGPDMGPDVQRQRGSSHLYDLNKPVTTDGNIHVHQQFT